MRATEDLRDHDVVQRLPRGPYAVAPEVVAADQRRRMLAALPRIVAEHGFEGVTVDQIVKLAQVRRNSFYEQFADKRDCFAAAHEIAQERLLGVLTFQCYTRAVLSERVGAAIAAGLDLLAAEPTLSRLVVLEAPGAGGEIAARHHEWIARYGRLLRIAAVGEPQVRASSPAIEPGIVGGMLSRVKESILAGKDDRIRELAPELTAFALSFYSLPGSLSAAAADGSASAQPQSPERRDALAPSAVA